MKETSGEINLKFKIKYNLVYIHKYTKIHLLLTTCFNTLYLHKRNTLILKIKLKNLVQNIQITFN